MTTDNSPPTSIIWLPSATPSKRPDLPLRGSQWWEHVQARLGSDVRRIEKLRDSSHEIVAHLPDPVSWGSKPSPFNGLVVGAIQSGKTESMIGVSALALDQGHKMIIVLTGNNEDLRKQTAKRFNRLLMGQSDRVGHVWTIEDARGPGPLGGYAPSYDLDATADRGRAFKIANTLRGNQAIQIVVKKEVSNLESVGGARRSANLSAYGDPVPILVIDDECDEGSVGSGGPTNDIPTAIEQLWCTSSDHLRVAYVGYTATAAANLLQDTDNPLYPREFIYLLRYPQESDSTLSWEQNFVKGLYTGGDIFYRWFGLESSQDENFIVQANIAPHEARNPHNNETLYEALIAYFVSGAYRLAVHDDEALMPRYSSPTACLYRSQTDHLLWRDAICDMLDGMVQEDKTVAFNAEIPLSRVQTEEDRWKKWFDSLLRCAERVRIDLRGIANTPRRITWDVVKSRLEEVFTRTRLKIVNSDDEVHTSLDFEIGWSSDGPVPPRDTYVIIVGGRSLSRGSTFPNLCTTFYSRESHENKPYADATLQLSRWFGTVEMS